MPDLTSGDGLGGDNLNCMRISDDHDRHDICHGDVVAHLVFLRHRYARGPHGGVCTFC